MPINENTLEQVIISELQEKGYEYLYGSDIDRDYHESSAHVAIFILLSLAISESSDTNSKNLLSSNFNYFQFTLTSYGKDIEPNLPDKRKQVINTFCQLSSKIGKEKVIWRYDQLLLTFSSE